MATCAPESETKRVKRKKNRGRGSQFRGLMNNSQQTETKSLTKLGTEIP
jgi:hypothetical protein